MAAKKIAEVDPRIKEWKTKVKEKTLTRDDMRDIILFFREGRVSAAFQSKEAKKRKSKKVEDVPIEEGEEE